VAKQRAALRKKEKKNRQTQRSSRQIIMAQPKQGGRINFVGREFGGRTSFIRPTLVKKKGK